jgi:hypothetical protein
MGQDVAADLKLGLIMPEAWTENKLLPTTNDRSKRK